MKRPFFVGVFAFCALVAGEILAAGVEGMFQKIYSGANVSTGDPEDGGVVIESGARFSTCAAGNPSLSFTDEATGLSYTLNANQTVGYKGLMMMTAGVTYRFAKNFDDNGHIKVVSPEGGQGSDLSGGLGVV